MQRIAWHERGSWEGTFEEHQAGSPVPKRSATEWDLLERHLKNGSDFAKRLTRKAGIAQAELPFFWRANERMSLEGVIDLAFVDPAIGSWLILDWKTDRVAPDKIEELRARHRPQIAAYWKAIAEMTSQSVEAGIYATATGQFLPYDEAELTREWERLSQLTANEFVAATSVPDG
jgi:ATP-dependent exoDNAse (exonuclease V) beta subunit